MILRIGVCPGSYDPITKGHEDIILRASKLFDKIYVPIMENSEKKYLFSAEQRLSLVKKVFDGQDNIIPIIAKGLFADFFKEVNGTAIVKGVRNFTDYDYECQIAAVNKRLYPPKRYLFPQMSGI